MTLPETVYAVPGGKDYLALFDGELGWQQWPAEEHGWQQRHGCKASLVESCSELEPPLAALALRLSGVVP